MPRTLAQNAQYIAETIKPAIKSAIEAQGVTVPSTDSFLDYADRIGEIEGGGSGYQLKDLPTGSISTVTDAAELPLNALKVSVEAWQEGSGDPSPSNVRPIHGWDSGEITVCDDIQSPTQTTTTTLDFPQTIYGAEWDVINGELKQTDGYIASYNGETLPSTWISDRDVYASGTTPTTGAEVVYKLATPTTIQLSPLSIRMLEGINNVYADCGEVIDGEYFVDEGAIDVRKVDYQIGSSGSIKTTDGRVLSGFASMSGYHARPLDVSGNWLDVDWSKDFEIGVAFKLTSLPTYQFLIGCGLTTNDRFKQPRLFYDNSTQTVELNISTDGSSWESITLTNNSIVANKWYFVKIKFTLSTLKLIVSTSEDLSTFATMCDETLSGAVYHNFASLSIGGDTNNSAMTSDNCLIDTFNTYIKGDGVNWGAFTGAFPS